MDRSIDCVVCGSCTVDILVGPFPLSEALGVGRLHTVEPIEPTTGGLVSNSGLALARLGMRVAAFSLTGADDWAALIRRRYADAGIDASRLFVYESEPTSTTMVMIDAAGDRSFATCLGAPNALRARHFLDNLDLFARSRAMLMGYYALMPELERDLSDVFEKIRETGCQTAMDAVGTGGSMQPLDRILPHLDFYVPSYAEARHQTGRIEPERIIDAYRECGAPGLLGVKLGERGAVLSPHAGEYLPIEAVTPPGPVIDTTGAGDCFYAGLLTGILCGMNVEDAGRLGAAVGACCVTARGASAALRGFAETAQLAGLVK